jgi:hypothetical protein
MEDLRPNGAGWQINLHEKGGKEHKMPCHHAQSEMLHAYIAAAGMPNNPTACHHACRLPCTAAGEGIFCIDPFADGWCTKL